jgi:hypothetical protein
MTISKEELSRLQEKLAEALQCETYPNAAEQMRLLLWKWLDERDAMLNQPTDARSVAAREHAERTKTS